MRDGTILKRDKLTFIKTALNFNGHRYQNGTGKDMWCYKCD